jgi:hypothetical protein
MLSVRKLQEVTGSYRKLQEVAGSCRKLQEVTGSYGSSENYLKTI